MNMNDAAGSLSVFEHYKAGNLQQAAKISFAILNSQPENLDILLLLAAICSELKNHDLAMKCIDAVINSKKQLQSYNGHLNFVEKKNFRETISLCMIVKNEENNLISFCCGKSFFN